ncbi:hypothetical protein JVT61DRAFT_10553 [Boletus reticuloceps]|uniref:Uncharacterized protein n=1 Tax=Boletus reticuloceps TaxID=495285 RepID=A0A8I2YXT6_9AGAM|nr:hypothetical protein JVT61DRAFT_10553 [Boletus reticuloceps]
MNDQLMGMGRMALEFDLAKLNGCIGPFAKAIECLEAVHATPDHVTMYWLGITAQLDHVFKHNSLRLDPSTIDDIRAIMNARFDELIENSPNDLYITAFFLNPEYRDAPIYATGSLNPLDIPPIVIATHKGSNVGPSIKSPKDIILKRVGLSLQRMLKAGYGDAYDEGKHKNPAVVMRERNPLLANIHPRHALKDLRTQIRAYVNGIDPFNCKLRSTDTTCDWWVALQQDELANALAIKIFSVLPTSMNDERTMSTITWLNSAKRNRQEISTLRDHIQIRQWYRYNPQLKSPRLKPFVKWQDVEVPTVLGKRPAPDSEDDDETAQPPAMPPNERTTESDAMEDQTIDSVLWLDSGKVGLDPAVRVAERKKFTLGGMEDTLNIKSAYIRDFLDDAPAPIATVVTEKFPNQNVRVMQAPLTIPEASEWDSWDV